MKWTDISVLVVAQSKPMGELISNTLYAFGVHDIAISGSTEDALNLVRKLGPDSALVAFDSVGHDFTLKLRRGATSPNRYLPVLAIIGGAKREHVRLALDAGAHDLAVWPISVDMMRQRLQRAVMAGRPFVQTKEYFGPCRRRRDDPDRTGPERRAHAAADAARRAAANVRLDEFFAKESAAVR